MNFPWEVSMLYLGLRCFRKIFNFRILQHLKEKWKYKIKKKMVNLHFQKTWIFILVLMISGNWVINDQGHSKKIFRQRWFEMRTFHSLFLLQRKNVRPGRVKCCAPADFINNICYLRHGRITLLISFTFHLVNMGFVKCY